MSSMPAIILFLPLAVAALILLANKGFKLPANVCALLSTGSALATPVLSALLIVNANNDAVEVIKLFT